MRWNTVVAATVAALTAACWAGPTCWAGPPAGGAPTATAGTQAGRDGAGCAVTLDCRAADFDAMPMSERVEFVGSLHGVVDGWVRDGGLVGGGVVDGEPVSPFDRWNNIAGVTDFWRDEELGPPGSWISTVNASILEGLERGAALALGRSDDTFGNPGAELWASYLQRLRDGELTSRAAHDRAWGLAEQASTEHGTSTAAARGLSPSAPETRFFAFSESYRWSLRNRPVAFELITAQVDLIQPGLGVPFYDWLTDVRNRDAAYRSTRTAYRLGEPDAVGGGLSGADLLIAYLPALLDEFRQSGRDSGSHPQLTHTICHHHRGVVAATIRAR